MNKIKLIYDVVKAMREKDEFKGTIKVRGTCESVECIRFENEFEKNTVTGLTRAKITTVLDHDGKLVRHESSTELSGGFNHHCCGHHHHMHRLHAERCCGGIKGRLTKLAFILNAINNMRVEEQSDKSLVVTLNLSDIPEDLKADLHARMAGRHHGGQCMMKGVTSVENVKVDLTLWINKNSEVDKVLLAASGRVTKESGETKGADLNAELNLNW